MAADIKELVPVKTSLTGCSSYDKNIKLPIINTLHFKKWGCSKRTAPFLIFYAAIF